MKIHQKSSLPVDCLFRGCLLLDEVVLLVKMTVFMICSCRGLNSPDSAVAIGRKFTVTAEPVSAGQDTYAEIPEGTLGGQADHRDLVPGAFVRTLHLAQDPAFGSGYISAVRTLPE